MAMGIESFFVCSLLILHDLQELEKKRKSQFKAPPWHDMLSLARVASAAPAASLCAGHVQQLGGASPLPNLMEVKG